MYDTQQRVSRLDIYSADIRPSDIAYSRHTYFCELSPRLLQDITPPSQPQATSDIPRSVLAPFFRTAITDVLHSIPTYQHTDIPYTTPFSTKKGRRRYVPREGRTTISRFCPGADLFVGPRDEYLSTVRSSATVERETNTLLFLLFLLFADKFLFADIDKTGRQREESS